MINEHYSLLLQSLHKWMYTYVEPYNAKLYSQLINHKFSHDDDFLKLIFSTMKNYFKFYVGVFKVICKKETILDLNIMLYSLDEFYNTFVAYYYLVNLQIQSYYARYYVFCEHKRKQYIELHVQNAIELMQHIQNSLHSNSSLHKQDKFIIHQYIHFIQYSISATCQV